MFITVTKSVVFKREVWYRHGAENQVSLFPWLRQEEMVALCLLVNELYSDYIPKHLGIFIFKNTWVFLHTHYDPKAQLLYQVITNISKPHFNAYTVLLQGIVWFLNSFLICYFSPWTDDEETCPGFPGEYWLLHSCKWSICTRAGHPCLYWLSYLSACSHTHRVKH